MALLNSFLTYLLLMVIIAGVAFLGGFIAISLKKKKNVKKETEKEIL